MKKLSALATLTVLAGFAPTVMAQTAGGGIFAGTSAAAVVSVPLGYAAPALQVPFAQGSGWGGVGLGGYIQTIDNAAEDYDASLGINFGLGDPSKYVGLDTAVSFASINDSTGGGDGFGDSGSFSLKLHTNLPDFTSFAIGVQSIGRWGSVKRFNKSSVYASASKFFPIDTQGLMGTVGIGDRAYSDNDNGNGVGVFGALAYYPVTWLSLIGEYTGRFANVAVSAAPIQSIPLTLTAGVVNLGDRFSVGTQFAFSVGYGIRF